MKPGQITDLAERWWSFEARAEGQRRGNGFRVSSLSPILHRGPARDPGPLLEHGADASDERWPKGLASWTGVREVKRSAALRAALEHPCHAGRIYSQLTG